MQRQNKNALPAGGQNGTQSGLMASRYAMGGGQRLAAANNGPGLPQRPQGPQGGISSNRLGNPANAPTRPIGGRLSIAPARYDEQYTGSAPNPPAWSLPEQPQHRPANGRFNAPPPDHTGDGLKQEFPRNNIATHALQTTLPRNLAVQPAEAPVKISLKKAAAKIAGPAAKPAAAMTTGASIKPNGPDPLAENVGPKEDLQAAVGRPSAAPRIQPAGVTSEKPAKTTSDKTSSQAEKLLQQLAVEGSSLKSNGTSKPDLAAMFARLSAQPANSISASGSEAGAAPATKQAVTAPAKPTPVAAPEKPTPVAAPKKPTHDAASEKPTLIATTDYQAKNIKPAQSKSTTPTPNVQVSNESTATDEQNSLTAVEAYLLKAYEALQIFGSSDLGPGNPAKVLWSTARRLRIVFTPGALPMAPADLFELQCRCAKAVDAFLKNMANGRLKEIEVKVIRDFLFVSHGDLLLLNSMLVEEGLFNPYMLENLCDLCTALRDPLKEAFVPTKDLELAQADLHATLSAANQKPNGEAAKADTKLNGTDAGKKAGSEEIAVGTQPTRKDVKAEDRTTTGLQGPVEHLEAWPTSQKRDKVAGSRTAMLKGLGHLTTYHQIQSVVWGGRLESIHLPPKAGDFAMVKFVTAEGCRKYFDATENGIEVPTEKGKLVILVEQSAGPNSVSDVLQHCIEGDVSRCVRAIGADEDWSDVALRRLAMETSKAKGDIDIIARGKTAKGLHFIEFRFATIYHALNFKRELHNDEEWEACNIVYSTDPCEAASGVHLNDENV
ncbi:hypothetical protein M011DRAFT_471895 [Sporormia fimetaria CBS 119925]|uniref:Uncharacterized protein n=1 Tax=Sporormia fimetaria CBS 119925 TaxID=1340428 RepID=A0A6A6V0M0_9PLEO|nr:hypothetical protein M011DRAFT_471895 [Sporormia fimetaria CBS 119925]